MRVLVADDERVLADMVAEGLRRLSMAVDGDSALERLITNLVQNAIKYNRSGGAIDVQVGDDPALVVVNTGDDVPTDEVSALFEPFRRRSGTRIDHSGGAGLGLSIARSIARAHDGIIAASSTGHDGLRVQVSFPAAPQDAVTR